MTLDYVNNIIARSNRNLLLRCLLGVLILVIGFAVGSNYLYNFVSGPFVANNDQLVKANSLNDLQQRWIKVKGDDKLLDTGYQYVSTSDSGTETVDSYYQALILGDKLLLVKTDHMIDGDTATGGLQDMPSDVRNEVITKLEQEYPNLKDTFLPYMLDTSDYRIIGYVGLAIAAIILILTLIGLSRWLSRKGDPLKHPIMKGLSRFGDPQQISQQIEMDLVGDPMMVGKVRLTKNWLLQATSSSLNATRLNDIMWAYKRITQHRTNGIKTGKTYSALILDRYGKSITVNGKEKVVDDTLNEINRRAPGAIGGYSAEILKMWNTNRAGFIATVDQRRQQAAAK